MSKEISFFVQTTNFGSNCWVQTFHEWGSVQIQRKVPAVCVYDVPWKNDLWLDGTDVQNSQIL